jgi:NADH pyrophosphatase NudC (nudix superfamily)
MPCQLMVGFFAYAESLDIHVDKKELEGTFYKLVLHIIPFSSILVMLLISYQY